MRKYFVYFMIYSFLGFVLERIINIIFLGYYYDNSVLVGPYQPLYGLGILLAIIFYDLYLKDMQRKLPKYLSLIIIAIITTGLSEFLHGEGYELFKGTQLCDYRQTFICTYPYVCVLPTSLFGVLSALAIILFHPLIDKLVSNMPKLFFKWTFWILLVTLAIDGIYTFFFTLL